MTSCSRLSSAGRCTSFLLAWLEMGVIIFIVLQDGHQASKVYVQTTRDRGQLASDGSEPVGVSYMYCPACRTVSSSPQAAPLLQPPPSASAYSPTTSTFISLCSAGTCICMQSTQIQGGDYMYMYKSTAAHARESSAGSASSKKRDPRIYGNQFATQQLRIDCTVHSDSSSL